MNQEVSITKEQVQKEMKYFRRLFPIVRLLDGERLLRRNDGMEAEPVEIDAPEICHCYDLWKYSAPCKHCIALEAVRSRKEKCKLEIVGNDIYQVIARYLEMNGKPYVMELVHRLDEDALTDLEEKQYLIEQLTGYNEKLYQDVLTGVFNRRYYEEKVKNMWGPVGIAMMDLDNFKYYNDSYGHNVGDLALNSAAKVILSNIRKSDFLIRYGGDEFLLVLPGIRKDAFDKKLNQIQKQLHQTTLDGYPGISLSVIIRENQEIELTYTEFEIFKLLAKHPGIVFSKEQIYDIVWKESYSGDYNIVMSHVRNIREKIEDNPSKPIYIQTVWGVGYRFNKNLIA